MVISSLSCRLFMRIVVLLSISALVRSCTADVSGISTSSASLCSLSPCRPCSPCSPWRLWVGEEGAEVWREELALVVRRGGWRCWRHGK